MLSNVFYGLAKHRVIHEFGEVFLEIVLGFHSKFGVEIDVRFQLCTLVKFDHAMNLLEDQSVFESLV